MGVVYEALDPKLERHVAIKMILGATPGLLTRFDREARSTGSLQHQNIVTIYEFGDQEGSPYLVMEYLEGMSLDAAISSGRTLSLATKLSICVDVCNGLNYAHDRGIIHRDIKPGNVMLLEDGNVKIVDFGIARIGDTGISRTEIVGSLHYMSPEQFQSQPLDRRTDIFSTGVVLYQLLTGTLPFQATGGEAAVMYRIIHEDPAPLSSYLPEYPPELDEVIRKALAKNRDLRYASARDFAFDLLAVMEKEKHQEVLQWMKRADIAMQRMEWNKAEDCLRQALKVDKNHTPAHQLLSQLQARLREQRKIEQVRQLRMQADEMFLERRYDEALRSIDQAVVIDETNKDLLSLRESIREAKSRAARLKQALRRAEEAHRAGDLEEAKLSVREALEIDPSETSAKALQVVILKHAEEQERQQQLRKLFDSARDQISSRNLTGAFQTLKEAEQLDASSVELYSLMKVVSTAREEQFRKMELDKLSREIEEALSREDYASAIAIANEGLQRTPREQGLLKLKGLAESQLQRAQLKSYAREQFLAASGLLEARKISEALSAIENALRTVPGDTQLERLRDSVNNQIEADRTQGRRRQLLDRAQEMAAAERFDDAVRILESVQRDFSGTEEIEPLLDKVRTDAKRAKSLAQVLHQAQQLLGQDSTEQAVQFLENKTLEISDARLFDLLESARREHEHFQLGFRAAIEEGNRRLQRSGAIDAARYLGAQPAKFREIPEFRALAEVIAKRVASDALDQELLLKSDPDAQVRAAEAALRANPDNEEIKRRCAVVRSRREQIYAITQKSRSLEASGQGGEAAKELKKLRQLHPQHSSLESEIRRLEGLDQSSKQPERPIETAKARPDTAIREHPDKGIGATVIMGRPHSIDRHTDVAVPPPGAGPREIHSGSVSHPSAEQQASPLSHLSSKIWLITGVAIVVMVGAGIIYRVASSPSAVLVKVNPIPEDSTLVVDGVSCAVPCQRLLSPGNHTVKAEHEGYTSLTQNIRVERGGSPNFSIPLSAIESSTARAATGADVENAPPVPPTQEKGAPARIDRGSNGGSASTAGRIDTRSALATKGVSAETKAAPKSPSLQPNTIPPAPAMAEVVVRNLPTAARVKVENGDTHQPDSSGVARFSVPVGNHSLEITAEGYNSRTIQRMFGAGGPAIDGTLDRDPELLAWATVESSSDKAALQAFLNKFPAGAHAQPARTKLDKLISSSRSDVAVNTSKDTNSTGSGIISDTSSQLERDKTAVLDVLKAYEKSYELQDLEGLQKLWPSMSTKTVQGLADFFKSTSSVKLTYIVVDNPKITGNEATLSFKQETSFVMNGKFQKPIVAKVNMKLKKTNPQGSWQIDSIH
jgi:serine/threonine-protein kinase